MTGRSLRGPTCQHHSSENSPHKEEEQYSLASTASVEEKLLLSKWHSPSPTALVEEKLPKMSRTCPSIEVYSLAPTLRVEEKLLTVSRRDSFAPTILVEEKLLTQLSGPKSQKQAEENQH